MKERHQEWSKTLHTLFLVKLRWKHSHTQPFNHNSTTSVLYPQNNLQSEHFVNQILYIFENELSFIVRIISSGFHLVSKNKLLRLISLILGIKVYIRYLEFYKCKGFLY